MPERSKTVDHALRLLEELRDRGPGTAAALGRRVGISRTAAGRMLASLEAHRLTRRTDHGFELGFEFLSFGTALEAGVRVTAAEPLQRLVAEFEETAVLAVRDGEDAVAVDQVVPRLRVVSIQYRPGTRHPLTVGAHGLAMLADVGIDLSQIDPGLLPRLAEAARIGYAVSHDELEPGVTGVAAPIVTGDGPPIAALGVVAPSARFPHIETVAEAVTAAARAVSTELMGMPATAPPTTA